jgi:DNA-binding MarR family transcriptional regulator
MQLTYTTDLVACATNLGYNLVMNENLNPKHLKIWRLFITSHAKLINQIDSQMQSEGQIPLHWYDVLIELYEAPQSRLRMSELAEKVLLSRSGLTRLVDRLEKVGYLRRELDPNDRRSFFAVLNDEGIVAMRGAWSIYAQGIQHYFTDYLSEEEAVVLERVFWAILENLSD